MKAYCWIREHNTSIPDHILNTMKESALHEFEDLKINYISTQNIELFGAHKKSCTCDNCNKVRCFREELEDTKFKLSIRE